jgi:hypothetical protein
MFDNQMIAEPVEGIGIQTGGIRTFQTLLEFEVEDREAKGLGRPYLRGIDSHSNCVVCAGAPGAADNANFLCQQVHAV